MPLKDRIRLLILGSLVAFFLYFFISTKPLNSDLYFLPLWSSSIEKEIELKKDVQVNNEEQFSKNETQENVYPFLINNRFGYFNSSGKVLFLNEIDAKVSASSNYWCEYGLDSKEVDIYSPHGKLVTTIKASGFPYIIEDKIYLFTPGGYGVSEYGTDGKRLWHYSHTAAITAFNASKKGTVIGYSDGKLVYVDANGNEVFNFYPGGSTYQVIVGLALSHDGSFIACVSGIDKQRIILIRIMDKQYKIVKHEYLHGNLYRQVFVAFDSNSSCAVFETSEGIGIVDCKTYDIQFLDEKDHIVGIGDDSKRSLMTILTQKQKFCRLIIIEKPFKKIATTDFSSNDAFFLQDKNKLFIGTSDKISAIEIRN